MAFWPGAKHTGVRRRRQQVAKEGISRALHGARRSRLCPLKAKASGDFELPWGIKSNWILFLIR